MSVIAHVFDESAGWEQRIAVSQLLDRLPSDRFPQSLVSIRPLAEPFRKGLDRPVTLCAARIGLTFTAAPSFRRFMERSRVEVIHAWGVQAAVAAAAAGATTLVLELFDPREAAEGAKKLRILAAGRRLAVVCSCEIARRRLIEGGLSPDVTVVIRPGVDFARINTARRSGLRESLGLRADQHVVVVNAPLQRSGSQFDTAFALTLLSHFQSNLALILPPGVHERETSATTDAREQTRIVRFVGSMPERPALVVPPSTIPLEDLVSIADTLVIAPRGDAPTTAIAWAMAAKTAVVGSAVHCVAELIANKVNGRLFKRTRGKSMATAIARLLRDRASLSTLTEAAHGQAYEVFSVRRYVDQHARVYENLRSGVLPADGIVDSSRIA